MRQPPAFGNRKDEAMRWGEIIVVEQVEHLLHLGAHAAVVYNDDTPMRIGQVRKEIQAEKKPGRSGIFTTGIVCEGGAG